MTPTHVPTVDISALVDPSAAPEAVRACGDEIAAACTDVGFLQVVGHGIEPRLRRDLHDAAAEFFSLDPEEKARIAMRRAGPAWRGWFPLGDELTSGEPDDKEGIYFGTELPPEDPRVVAGLPLHGANLFPERPARLGPLVLEWMDRATSVGRAILSGMAVSFGLDRDWFDRWCADPTVLFRIFHYPPAPPGFAGRWGVAEHTDYGLLTLLVQDDTGGLEVRVGDAWVAVPPTPDAIVCNLGDMLERVTGGRFRSTAHRVQLPRTDRLSFPLFLDPAWDAELTPLPGCEPTGRALAEAASGRWDGRSVFDMEGPYGDHLLSKVAQVFPDLFSEAVEADRFDEPS